MIFDNQLASGTKSKSIRDLGTLGGLGSSYMVQVSDERKGKGGLKGGLGREEAPH